MDDDPARLRRLVPLPPLPRATADLSSSSSQRRLSPSTPLPPVRPVAALRFAPGSGYYHVPPAQAPVAGGGGVAGSHHARSLSQPSFFSMDFLAPHMYAHLAVPAPIAFSPPAPPSSDQGASGLPPLRAGHRRSQSDILVGFSQPILQMTPPALVNPEANSNTLVGSYMSSNGLGVVGSSGNATQEPHNNMESQVGRPRAWSPADSSENEAESVDGRLPRHCRSLSADGLIGSLSLGKQSSNLPPPCSGVGAAGSGSIGGATALFATNMASGEFNEDEKKKIMNNERLAEIALADPKRVKRILSNRVSAAKSKERKVRYMSELEHKVQVLQMETTTLSQQVSMLQRDLVVLSTQNNELKIRLRAMEQQAQLRDALNEALHSEVQRLKVAAGEISDSHMSNGSQQQSSRMILLEQLQNLNQPSQAHQDQQQQSGRIDAQQQQWNF